MNGGIQGQQYLRHNTSAGGADGASGNGAGSTSSLDQRLHNQNIMNQGIPVNPDQSPQNNYVEGGDDRSDVKKQDPTDFSASPNYLDWDHNILLDLNPDLLSTFDFNPTGESGSIMQKIQYQSNVHDQKRFPESGFAVGQSPGHAYTGVNSVNSSNVHLSLGNQDHNASLPMHTQQQQQQPQLGIQPPSQGTITQDVRRQRRPCDHCRRRKTKCVIIPGTNNCVQCESKSLTCTYVQQAAKKDDPEESAAKRVKRPEATHLENGGGQSLDIVPPNVPIRDVAPIQDYSAMSNSLLRKTLSLQFPRSSFYVGPTSYLFDNNLLDVIITAQNSNTDSALSGPGRRSALSKIEQVNLSDSISLRKVGERTQFVLKDDQSKLLYQSMLNDVDAIEKFVAPHGQILIDLYFRIIHPLYPILHKKVFLEKYSRTHREFSAPLLAAVYVLAIHWWDYDPQLNRFPKPNVEHILRIALTNYLSEILKRPKLSAVQAGLLLLQCKHIVRDLGASIESPTNSALASALLSSSFSDSDYNDWVLCSQVVALSEELGLGLDCDQWKLPKWERGLRKRLAWAVYMEDKWLALKNARPSHINSNNWVVLLLVEEDFPEKHGDGDLKEGSSDINNGKKNFMNLISLSRTLSEILDSFYSMKAMKEITDINDVLRLAKPMQLNLRSWYHSLPVELQMNSVQPRKLCANGYLQLAYFAAELTLHRKIITILHQQSIEGVNIHKELLNVCRTAARTRLLASIEFVRDLKPEHIHSFWHSSSSANFTLIGTFAALLFISSPTNTEADYYKEQVFNYRWILKMSSKGFVQVGDALQKMDLVLSHIPGLLNESVEQPMVAPNVPTIDYNKVYQQQLQQNQKSELHNVQSQQPQRSGLPQQGRPQPQQKYSYGATNNSQFLNNRPSPTGYNGNTGKVMELTRPSSAQQYRVGPQNTQSPYGSPLSFSAQTYTSQQGTTRTTHATSMNSPKSTQGLSPKEVVRQSKSSLSGQSRANEQAVDRRSSSGNHNSDSASNKDNQSSRASSPLMMRSPLIRQQLHQQ